MKLPEADVDVIRPGVLLHWCADLRGVRADQAAPASVEALCAALPTATSASEPQLQRLLGRAV